MSATFSFRTRRIDTSPIGEWGPNTAPGSDGWTSVSPSGTALSLTNAVFKTGSSKDFTIRRGTGEYELQVRKELGVPVATSSTVFVVDSSASQSDSGTATYGPVDPVTGEKTATVLVGGTSYTVTRSDRKATNSTSINYDYVLFDSSSVFNVSASPATSGGTPQTGKYGLRKPQGQTDTYNLFASQTALGYVPGDTYVVNTPAYSTVSFLLERIGNNNNTVQVNVPGSVAFKLTFVAKSGKTVAITFPATTF